MGRGLLITAALCAALAAGCDPASSSINADRSLIGASPEAVERQAAPSASEISVQSPAAYHPEDVGGGIKLELGASPEDIQSYYPSNSNCMIGDDSDQGQYCFIENTTDAECPVFTGCSDLSFTFHNKRLIGFGGAYPKDIWNNFHDALTSAYGQPKYTRVPDVGRMGGRIWEWRVATGCISLLQFTGEDINGNPIRTPFQIGFDKGSCPKHPADPTGDTANASGANQDGGDAEAPQP